MSDIITGGCLCGHIRYQIDGAVNGVCYCHCSTCRRTTGSGAVLWGTIASEHFSYIAGQPGLYVSSDIAVRQFCPKCGSQITLQHNDYPEYLYVTLPTLDDPDVMPAQSHIYTMERLSWMVVDKHLPEVSEC